MRAQKILRRLAIIFMIGCIIFLAIDIFKSIRINLDYMKMQSTDRISLSSDAPEIRYEPSDYLINNKEDILTQVKDITKNLKNEQTQDDVKGLFEIGNIHKLEVFVYEYEQYAVIKYKLLNIIEDMPKLYSATKDCSNEQLQSYFNENSVHLEKYYGLTDSDEFVKFAKSLKFLENNKISFSAVRTITIDFDYETDTLTFNLRLDAGDNSTVYFVKARYYESSDNQVKPYVEISVIE